MTEKWTRRSWIPLAGAGLLAGVAGIQFRGRTPAANGRKASVRVTSASSYEDAIPAKVLEGLRGAQVDVKDKRVLLAVQLEQYDPTRATNADASVVRAAVAAVRAMGAAEVRLGAGPALERDARSLAEMAGYTEVPDFDEIFVDLNHDEVSPTEGFRGETIFLPNTALRADLVISIAKLKTDAANGAALSLQNLTTMAPGTVYGWPKTAFRDPDLILSLARQFRRSFAIVDGVVGMEGNGPYFGNAKPADVLVMGADLGSVDATCCRIMGMDPERIGYLALSGSDFGRTDARGIEVVGASVESLRKEFGLPEPMRALRS